MRLGWVEWYWFFSCRENIWRLVVVPLRIWCSTADGPYVHRWRWMHGVCLILVRIWIWDWWDWHRTVGGSRAWYPLCNICRSLSTKSPLRWHCIALTLIPDSFSSWLIFPCASSRSSPACDVGHPISAVLSVKFRKAGLNAICRWSLYGLTHLSVEMVLGLIC